MRATLPLNSIRITCKFIFAYFFALSRVDLFRYDGRYDSGRCIFWALFGFARAKYCLQVIKESFIDHSRLQGVALQISACGGLCRVMSRSPSDWSMSDVVIMVSCHRVNDWLFRAQTLLENRYLVDMSHALCGVHCLSDWIGRHRIFVRRQDCLYCVCVVYVCVPSIKTSNISYMSFKFHLLYNKMKWTFDLEWRRDSLIKWNKITNI